jgi:hypothetical protein
MRIAIAGRIPLATDLVQPFKQRQQLFEMLQTGNLPVRALQLVGLRAWPCRNVARGEVKAQY